MNPRPAGIHYLGAPGLLSRLELEMLARSTIATTRCCIEHGLRCTDPPVATTRLLEWLGYGASRARTFWSRLEAVAPISVEIYRYKGTRFYITVIHRIEPLREMSGPTPCPLGPLDWERRDHHFAPNAHTARAYLEGGIGGNDVRINVARLLCLIERSAPGSLDAIERLVLDLIWNRLEPAEMPRVIAAILGRWRKVLSNMLPFVPMSPMQVEESVPILRKIGRSRAGYT